MDRYTKTLLTIIAVSLMWIAFKDSQIISNAMASSGTVEVKIVGMDVSRYQALPVKIEGKIHCEGD
jgi:hypothetical protein